MAAIEYRWTIPTRFGPATYTLELTDAGQVRVAALPFAGLPDSVLKLTYGANWEAVRTYLADLAATLPYRVAAALSVANPPVPFRALVDHFRESFAVAAESTRPSGQDPWFARYAFDEGELNRGLKWVIETGDQGQQADDQLAGYLETLLPTVTDKTARVIYAVLSTLGTAAGKDILLGFLESEGRHPYTPEILSALASYPDPVTRQRLEAVYRAGKFSDDDLEPYIKLLAAFSGTEVTDHLTQLLDQHPEQVDKIVESMRANQLTDKEIAHLVRSKFDAEENYRVLDDLLLALLRLGVSELRIGLADMNRKVDAPAFTDVPPVNWPQQLEPGWAALVSQTQVPEALDIIGQYLSRPEPRLQRNALLQLKVLLAENPPEHPLPAAIESRLRALAASRYDKVYVEVLNVLGRRSFPLTDRGAMFEAILGISIGSRYRFVVLTALRRVGHSADHRTRARAYLSEEIRTASDPVRLEQIAALLPFVEKYLGNTDDLRSQLQARVSAGR